MSLILFLMPANFSSAAKRDFDAVSLNIPSGWKANQKGQTVLILRDDHTAALSITVASREGIEFEDISQEFARRLDGSDFEIDDDGDANFVFNDGKSFAMILNGGENFVVIAATGFDSHGDEMSKIIDSMSVK